MNNKLIKGYIIPLSILFKDGDKFMANVGEVAVGDKVTTNAEYDWNGTHLASFVRTTTYDVIQVGAESKDKDRYIVIGLGSAVTAGVDIATLTVVQKKDGSPVTSKTDPKKDETFDVMNYDYIFVGI